MINKIKRRFEKMKECYESGFSIELDYESILEIENNIRERNGLAIVKKVSDFILEIQRKQSLVSIRLEEQGEVLKICNTQINKKITELYSKTIESFEDYLKETPYCDFDESGNLFYKEDNGEIFEKVNVEKLITELYICNSLLDTLLRRLGYGFNFTKYMPFTELLPESEGDSYGK